jgi:large subunit ribosomal protein L15
MRLHELTRDSKPAKRVGRGMGSGRGKTSGRGVKGQKSRSGHHMMPAYFEGGQMPLTQRLPKLRGFRNPRQRWASFPVDRLKQVSGTTINLETLQKAGLAGRADRYVKIVGPSARAGKSFKLEGKFSVTVAAITKSAQKVIEAAGGTVKVEGGPIKTEPKKDATQAPKETASAETKTETAQPDTAEEPSA